MGKEFRLVGEISVDRVEQLADDLMRHSAEVRGDVTIDCSELVAIDATGVAVITAFARWLEEHGRAVHLELAGAPQRDAIGELAPDISLLGLDEAVCSPDADRRSDGPGFDSA